MAEFTYWTLPMPVVGKTGASIAANQILLTSFGGVPDDVPRFFAAYYGTVEMAARDFDFWNPKVQLPDRFFFRGEDYGSGFGNQIFFDVGYEKFAYMKVGNTIGPVSYLTIPTAGPENGWTNYIEYSVMTIEPDLMLAGAGRQAPTPADIVAQAQKFAKKYGTPVNSNDCHYIAAAVAASAGATFVAGGNTQNVVDPSQNIEHGFWRIAYRGSDPRPVDNWQTLVKPGDIVRMGWDKGGFHTVTVLAVAKDKSSITVYDNTNTGGTIGIHEVRYGEITKPGSITIYRLTTDNTYLEKGSEKGEIIPGTVFNDRVLGQGGDDTLFGAGGNDILDGGKGADRLDGGAGADRLYAGVDKVTDTFVFDRKDSGLAAAAWDHVFNFQPDADARAGKRSAGADLIDLTAIDADPARGDQALRFVAKFVAAGKDQADGQVRAVDAGPHVNVEIDWNGDSKADLIIQVMNVAKLTADDFLL